MCGRDDDPTQHPKPARVTSPWVRRALEGSLPVAVYRPSRDARLPVRVTPTPRVTSQEPS
jgi:hypothetical protein